MDKLRLKPTYKVVKAYYAELDNLMQLSLFTEGAVSPTFAALLRHCARQFDWTLAEQFTMKPKGVRQRTIRVDGALLDPFKLIHGVWEAKDSDDDLEREVDKKFRAGYPQDNIIFQAPERAILWQDGYEVWDADISRPPVLVDVLRHFFAYQPPAYEQWEQAVEEFKLQVPNLAAGLLDLIRAEQRTNPRFVQAFEDFTALCQQAINPNISPQAVEEMLIQHLLTERIFRKVFDNPDFADRNIIAREIEKVILALASQHFSRRDFLKPLDRFYGAIETTAATIDDFSQKQGFLNTIYEKFFQGFSVKVADTHGIVYTPQPIVDFMVRLVEDVLQKEFDRSLSDEGVHILDPFVGTGNFILRVMREIRRSRLPHKYAHELHCNEVMLLPYYIAAMNIEHEYYELTGSYHPFEGICLVDTFELAEQKQLALFTKANTERVERQKDAPIFVIIGNPPYNAGQVNENDNNKNRQYPVVDRSVSDTYGKASRATLVRKLNDPYVKAIRWASDRIGAQGIVAFVTNNSFVSEITFDGMRKHLAQDFDAIYILDLGGNVRKNPKLSGTTHNVFGIQIGVSINILVRAKDTSLKKRRKIYYARVGEFWRKEQKYDFLDEKVHIGDVEWTELEPDVKYNWLTEGMSKEFETFIPIATKAARKRQKTDVQAIFQTLSLGVSTNRDRIVYDFDRQALENRVERFCENYNTEVFRYQQKERPADVDNFVDYEKVKWSSTLKSHLKRGTVVQLDSEKIRTSLYRPFTRMFLYFDSVLNDRPALFQRIFPNSAAEVENRAIWLKVGSEVPIFALAVKYIPNLLTQGGSQCFPFYVYDEDGTNRRENITDWALAQFREHYEDDAITKWDIFHYVYGLLHHPTYRETYAANLKRELPRIPFAHDPSTSLGASFWGFAQAGAKLAELHVHYKDQPEYKLKWIESDDAPISYRVEKMRLSRDKAQLVVNDFLTLASIPPRAFDYRLGNRSALHWIIDRYRVRTDKRSGIVNDPNRLNDPQYIIRLIGKVITVSLETVGIVEGLPELQ